MNKIYFVRFIWLVVDVGVPRFHFKFNFDVCLLNYFVTNIFSVLWHFYYYEGIAYGITSFYRMYNGHFALIFASYTIGKLAVFSLTSLC